jgi:acylglycerol lipase
MTSSEMITAGGGVALFTRHWPAEGARATVVLVHGLAEHSGRWDHVGEYLAGRGLETYAFDLRGHGRSGGPRLDARRFGDFLDDIELMLERARRPGRPIVLYGHSLGGLLVAAYAQSRRTPPDLLVLSAPALDANLPAFLELVLQILGRIAPRVRVGSPVEGEQLSRDPEVGVRYFADPLVQTKGTARFGLIFLRAMKATAAGMADVGLPTLVIHGGADTLVPTASSSPLADLAGFERKVLENLRHEVHNEPEWTDVLDGVAGWIEGRVEEASPR